MKRIGVLGRAGAWATHIAAIGTCPTHKLAGAAECAGYPRLHPGHGRSRHLCQPLASAQGCDVLIDFTARAAFQGNCDAVVTAGRPVFIGDATRAPRSTLRSEGHRSEEVTPAVDHHNRPGHEACILADKVGDGGGDFVRAGHATQRNRGFH